MIYLPSDKMAERAKMYLFDTDIITNVFKKKPSRKLIQKLESLDKSKQFISVITVTEIVYGAYKSQKPDFHLNNLIKILIPAVNIVSFNSESAFFCGKSAKHHKVPLISWLPCR